MLLITISARTEIEMYSLDGTACVYGVSYLVGFSYGSWFAHNSMASTPQVVRIALTLSLHLSNLPHQQSVTLQRLENVKAHM